MAGFNARSVHLFCERCSRPVYATATGFKHDPVDSLAEALRVAAGPVHEVVPVALKGFDVLRQMGFNVG